MLLIRLFYSLLNPEADERPLSLSNALTSSCQGSGTSSTAALPCMIQFTQNLTIENHLTQFRKCVLQNRHALSLGEILQPEILSRDFQCIQPFLRSLFYEVISIEKDWYRIMTEIDETYLLTPKVFEVLETEKEHHNCLLASYRHHKAKARAQKALYIKAF